MRSPRKNVRTISAALGVALGLAGAVALAQQPPGDKDPSRLPLGEVQPGGRPMPPQGQPGGQPGQPPPGMPPGGMQRPARPQLPPGMQPPRRLPPGPPPQPAPAEDHGKGGHGAAHHCPGHGPLDSPHAPNWWQGIIGVNNDAAQFGPPDAHGHLHRTDGFVSQLLWRYDNSKDECDPKNQPPPFLASLLNFGLLAFVLFRFGKKPLAEALANRRKTMMAEIDTATNLKNASEGRLTELEDKLQNLDETLEQMKKDYIAQSEAERKHVLAEAEERRARMLRDVEIRLEQEMKAARQELLAESVEQAVELAEQLLKKSVKAQDHERSADEFVSGLAAAWKSDALGTRNTNAGGAA